MALSEKLEKQLGTLKAMALPAGQYAVFGGSALALYGLRDSDDLDVAITRALWETLSKAHPKEAEPELGRLALGELEFWVWWFPDRTPSEPYIARATEIAGVPVVQPEDMLAWKRRMNREKDRRDIALLEAYLQNRKEKGN